jgi:YD repeat-containing protein
VTALGLAKDAGATTAATPLISNIIWQPFGPPSAWNWELTASPQPYERVYDLSGRVTRLRLGDVVRDITYDAADRITKYTHYIAATAAANPALDQTFAYDTLSRLQSVTTSTTTWAITYDANGNRTQVSQSGTARNYITPATSNKLANLDNPVRSIGHDAAGNRTADQALFSTTFNLANRLSTLTRSGATTTYAYDNEGRRIRKFTSAGTGASSASTVLFVYDKEGQLLGDLAPVQRIR